MRHPSIITAMIICYVHHIWWRRNLRSPHAVALLQTALRERAEIDKGILAVVFGKFKLLTAVKWCTSAATAPLFFWFRSKSPLYYRKTYLASLFLTPTVKNTFRFSVGDYSCKHSHFAPIFFKVPLIFQYRSKSVLSDNRNLCHSSSLLTPP